MVQHGNKMAAAVVTVVLLLAVSMMGGAIALDSGGDLDNSGSSIATDDTGNGSLGVDGSNAAGAIATRTNGGGDEGASGTAYQTCGALNVFYNHLTDYCCK